MSKNEKGFYLFFDWIEELEELQNPEDAWSIVLALRNYALNGTDPTQSFSGAYRAFVGNIYNQIKRAERNSEEQRQKAFKRWNKENGNTEHNTAMQGKTPVLPSNDTNTHTNTNTYTNIVKEESIKEEKRKRVLPPSLEEVRQYLQQKGKIAI